MVSQPAGASRPRAPQAPGLADLAASLSDLLETRVTIEMGRRKGKVTVEFATMDDLRRVVGVMVPSLAAPEVGDAIGGT